MMACFAGTPAQYICTCTGALLASSYCAAEYPRRELHAWFSLPHPCGTSVAVTRCDARDINSSAAMILVILQGTSAICAVPARVKVLLVESVRILLSMASQWPLNGACGQMMWLQQTEDVDA